MADLVVLALNRKLAVAESGGDEVRAALIRQRLGDRAALVAEEAAALEGGETLPEGEPIPLRPRKRSRAKAPKAKPRSAPAAVPKKSAKKLRAPRKPKAPVDVAFTPAAEEGE